MPKIGRYSMDNNTISATTINSVIYPVKIVSIDIAGGACPYQIEGLTDQNEYIYLRYRHGQLRVGIAKTEGAFWSIEDKNPYNVFDQKIGDDLDGYADGELFKEKLKDLVIFPDGFEFKM